MVINVSTYTQTYFPFVFDPYYIQNVILNRNDNGLALIAALESIENKSFHSNDINYTGDFLPKDVAAKSTEVFVYISSHVKFKNNIIISNDKIILQRSWTNDVISYLEFSVVDDGLILLKRVFWSGDYGPSFYTRLIIGLLVHRFENRAFPLPMPSYKYETLKFIMQTALEIYGSTAFLIEIEDELISPGLVNEIDEVNSGIMDISYPNLGFIDYEIVDGKLFYLNSAGTRSAASEFQRNNTLFI